MRDSAIEREERRKKRKMIKGVVYPDFVLDLIRHGDWGLEMGKNK
jgi:hypothetical protein